ncbi:HK97-gp10 family putative phage morphogenesis protein [Nafulsella turpanensis]|uniref:HK97-gp10 family putative phage morphogenesis protein n=1 Tax=Nafulsella turpanensis TaxID=1265690 RepID=UPI00034548FE|nr:HK97-gp10 family putative phage morphogenesis protein [Nafulsella turpanensis]
MSKKESGFELEGFREVDDMMKQLPMEFQAEILYKLNRKAANIVKKEMQANAPDSEGDHIRESIMIKRDPEDMTGVTVGVTSKKGWMVRFLEYGTKKRETRKGADRGAITQPDPFVRESIDNTIDEVIQMFNTNYLKLVKRVVKKYNKTFRK